MSRSQLDIARIESPAPDAGGPRFLSLAAASDLLASGEATSVELTGACIAAARRTQPVLNAFIDLREEQALRRAEAADRARERGEAGGPLHGIPLAHKDVFYRQGERTTAGSAVLEDFRPSETAFVLDRLDAAGAVDLGTLNLAEFCVGPTGQNDHTGSCFNPWDPERITGGSSSGSGAAVAARLAYGSIGSDTGGSIRLPSGFCGVTGLKPSHGRVSLRGGVERCWSLDVFGPLARTAEDAAIMMSAVAGFDPDDPLSRSKPVPDYRAGLKRPVQRMKVAVPAGLLDQAEDDVAARHRDALDALRALGIEFVEVTLPDTQRLYDLTTIINNAEATYLHRAEIEARPEAFNGSTLSRINRGYDVRAIDYLASVRGQARERADFERAVLGGCAALYLPLIDIEVPRLADVMFGDTDGADRIVPKLTRWTRWVSYLGLPGLSLPIGFSRNCLPVACQLIGHFFDEETLLGLGHAYQQVTAWHEEVPPVA